ncbi:MAG: TlpA disulfide reductase family protein [Planctomycetia bacterium]|nr:TlpA disulfide reductase family protein [Planctomycetia bacterium]
MYKFAVSIFASAIALSGCGPQPTVTTTSSATDAPAPAAAAAVSQAPIATVALHEATHNNFRDLLESKRGKVVFVDYWGTWCGNCMEEFPHTVELANKHRDAGLAVISVAMELDPTDEATQAAALDFLTKQNATFENLLYEADGTTEEAQAGFNMSEGTVLPYFQLYDRAGKLVKEFTFSDPQNPISREDIDAAVAEAVAGGVEE